MGYIKRMNILKNNKQYQYTKGSTGDFMKIAVCFFGHLRTFKECAKHIKHNLLDKYDCDLFMHTWSTYNHHTKTHHENRDIKGDVSKNIIVKT